jgi:macrolide phosphotransferase
MASTPFTLAALATSAVSGLEISGTRVHTSGRSGDFLSAVLATNHGEVIIRIPQTPSAEVRQSGELMGLAAFEEGARAQLPFSIPTTLGSTRAGDARAVVSTFLPGVPASFDDFDTQPLLLEHLAEALVAIHGLPAGIIQRAGLPVRSAEEVRTMSARLVQRAADTGVLPATVHQRWREVLDSDSLWSFGPTVVHGSLDPEWVLIDDDSIAAILGWHELSLGDPAADLSWLLAGDPEMFRAALIRYSSLRGVSGQAEIEARARFYHELEVAKWLLHGVESHDAAIVDDAVAMLDQLVDRLMSIGTPLPQRAVLSDLEVEHMLSETPEDIDDLRSETAEYDALDEDRVFTADEDFDAEDEHRTAPPASRPPSSEPPSSEPPTPQPRR